jgi:glycosyl transferase family 25
MSMSVYVVNLPEQTIRRQFMALQLAQLPPGFNVEWVAGVRGSALSADELAADYDEAGTIALAGRPLYPGEIGCSLSHRGIYRKMMERHEPFAAILEDDALVGDRFPELVEMLRARVDPAQPRVILLYDYFVPSLWQRSLLGRHRLMRVWRGRSTMGYVLTLAAAEALNRAQTPIRRAADWWPDFERYGVIETWGIRPGCVAPSLFDRNSGIAGEGARGQVPLSLLERVRRKGQEIHFQCTSWKT